MDNWGRKDTGSGNYASRGVWRQRSSTHRPPPPFAGQRSVPSWEKKFCESIGLVPWHKLLEAKKFMYLYEDIVRWNDTAAEEAFKNAKSRFWAEINGLPCNIKLPDPDIYIDEVDWNPDIDPELLLDLERGADMESKSGEAEGDGVMQVKPFVLDSEPFLCSNNGWDDDLDEVPVPVPPTGSGESQGQMNWNDTANSFSCNVDANQCGAWDAREDLDGSKGWDNWDDDGQNYSASNSKCNLEESGNKNSWDEALYGNGNLASNSQWRRKDCGGYEGGERAAETGANRKTPVFTHDGYRSYRGIKNNRGRRRQETLRWGDRKPSYGRW